MNTSYKLEETQLKEIIEKHVTPTENYSFKLLIYYKNKKLSNLIITNRMHRQNDIELLLLLFLFIEDSACAISSQAI